MNRIGESMHETVWALMKRIEALAAIRAEGAKQSAFLMERGLPAMPDRYPELP